MTIAENLLGEFEAEAQTTRKFLERLPEDKLRWKPHEKSKTAGNLALHIATIPGMISRAVLEDEWSGPGGPVPEPQSVKQVLVRWTIAFGRCARFCPCSTTSGWPARGVSSWTARRSSPCLALPY